MAPSDATNSLKENKLLINKTELKIFKDKDHLPHGLYVTYS